LIESSIFFCLGPSEMWVPLARACCAYA